MGTTTTTHPTGRRVVIVGAGFGGLAAGKSLAKAGFDVTVVDRRNYHLFQPLLYQVAAAGLSPADIAWPIRSIFRRYRNVSVRLGAMIGLDADARQVIVPEGRVPYDYLVLATGSTHAYFGHDEWEPFAPGLKRIVDATEIRKRVLLAFERAEIETDEAERRRQLTLIIVGAGPTGVEMAGAIAELARYALMSDFRNIDTASARIVLVEGSDRVLGALQPGLSDYAKAALGRLGVEVQLGRLVKSIGERGVMIGEEFVPAATVVWAAGVAVPSLGQWLQCETDGQGRVVVAPDLSVPGRPEIFVIGDAARVVWKDGQIVPGIAPAAKQEGAHVARVIGARVEGRQPPAPFRYKHAGNLATIGRNAAVVDLNGFRLKGWLAWWFWGLAHIYFLIGVRSPILVSLQWLWSYLTYGRGARLITGLAPLSSRAEVRGKAEQTAE